jgi:hypothetical protein
MCPETKSINGWDLWFVSIKGTKIRHRQQRERKTQVCSDLESDQSDAKRRQQRSADFSPLWILLRRSFCWWCSPTDSHLLTGLSTQQRPDDGGVSAAWQWCPVHFIPAAGCLGREQGVGWCLGESSREAERSEENDWRESGAEANDREV